MPEPKFEWFKDKAGKFRFRPIAANGEKIAASLAYSSREACENGIESVKKKALIAKIVEAKARAEQAKIILNDLVTKILRIFGWDNGKERC